MFHKGSVTNDESMAEELLIKQMYNAKVERCRGEIQANNQDQISQVMYKDGVSSLRNRLVSMNRVISPINEEEERLVGMDRDVWQSVLYAYPPEIWRDVLFSDVLTK